MSTREEMVAAINQYILPRLRSKGFKGSLPHFRRPLPTRIDLLTFQFNKYGGSFVVEIAQCGPEGITTYCGKAIPPGKVTAHDVNERLRLGSSKDKADHWFDYEVQAPNRVALELLQHIVNQAEQWWSDRANPLLELSR